MRPTPAHLCAVLAALLAALRPNVSPAQSPGAPVEVRHPEGDSLTVVADVHRGSGGPAGPTLLLFHQAGGSARGEYRAITPRLLRDPLVLWGSSYRASLVLQVAARRSADVRAVLAFSPASGDPMAGCEPGPYMGWLARAGVATLVLRPRVELDDSGRVARLEAMRRAVAEVFVADWPARRRGRRLDPGGPAGPWRECRQGPIRARPAGGGARRDGAGRGGGVAFPPGHAGSGHDPPGDGERQLQQANAALSPGDFSDESFRAAAASGAGWLFIRSDDERFVREGLDAKIRELAPGSALWVIRAGSAHATDLLAADPDLSARLTGWLVEQLGGAPSPR